MALLDRVSYRVLDTTIRKRIDTDKAAALVLVDGVPGSGKSSWSLAAAEYLDPTFSVDNICFNQAEWLKLMETSEPGQILIWDEAGEMNARASNSELNIAASLILEMLRYTMISTFFTIPSARQIDVNVVRLANFWATSIPFDRSTANSFYKTRAGVRFRVLDPTKPSKSDREPGWVYPKVVLTTRVEQTERFKQRAAELGVTLKNTDGVTSTRVWHPKGVWLEACSQDLWDEYCKRKNHHFHSVLNKIQAKAKMSEMKRRARQEKMESGHQDWT